MNDERASFDIGRKNMEDKRFWSDFIEKYREHSCLWDVKSPDYCNKNKRNSSYEVLLKILQQVKPHVTLDALKKKISNMRTVSRNVFWDG